MPVPIMAHVAAGSSLLPAVVGIMRYKELDRAMKLFTVFCALGVLNLALELVLALLGIRNYFLSDLYLLVEVPFIALIYHRSIGKSSTTRICQVLTLVFILSWMIEKTFFADPQQMNSALAMITAIFLVAMSVVTLNAHARSTSSKLSEAPIFWVLTGTILYYSGSFAVMGLGNELLKADLTYFIIAWHVNWILFIVSMLLYGRGLLCKSQA